MSRIAPMLRRAVAIVLLPLVAAVYLVAIVGAMLLALGQVLAEAVREVPQLAEPMGLRPPFRWWAQLWQGEPPR